MKNESLKSIGDRVRLARVSAKLSQSGLAAAGGPSRPTISRIERGEPVESLESQLQRIALVCRVNLGYLLKGRVSGEFPEEIHGVSEQAIAYRTDMLDGRLLGACIRQVLTALNESQAGEVPDAQLGAVVAELYNACITAKKPPTYELLAPFLRVLLA